jgi:hypothetical protein
LRAAGATAVDMARHYSVTREAVLNVIHGHTWRNGATPNCHWAERSSPSRR